MKTEKPARITLDELRALRMRAQRLAPRLPRKALVDVVRRLCGVNAQLYSAMALSLRARVENLSIEDVESNRVMDRVVVRTWCMRGTMHLLAADDVDWLLSAVAPSEVRGSWLEHERAEQVLDAAHSTSGIVVVTITAPSFCASSVSQIAPLSRATCAGGGAKRKRICTRVSDSNATPTCA